MADARQIDKRDLETIIQSKAAKLHYWRRARSRVEAGSGRARMGVCGSSSVNGTGAGDVNGASNAQVKRFSTRMSERFNKLGLPSRCDGVYATGNLSGQSVAVYDPRITMPSSWGPGVANTMGGNFFQNTSNMDALGFAFANAFDKFEIGYSQSTSNPGIFEVLVDDVVVDTVNISGAAAFIRKQYTVAKGVHTIKVRKSTVSTTAIYIHHVEAWDSTSPHVSVCNAGWGSSDAANWNDASSPTRPASVLRAHAFDLTVFLFGINVQSTATIPTLSADVAAWSAHYQSVIDSATKDANGNKQGDGLIIVPHWNIYDPVIQRAFNQEALRLAEVNGCAVLNLADRMESRALLVALGYHYSDPSHVNAVAHADFGHALADLLIAA